MPATNMSDEDLDELVLDCAASFTSHHCVVSAISVHTREILDVEYVSNF